MVSFENSPCVAKLQDCLIIDHYKIKNNLSVILKQFPIIFFYCFFILFYVFWGVEFKSAIRTWRPTLVFELYGKTVKYWEFQNSDYRFGIYM